MGKNLLKVNSHQNIISYYYSEMYLDLIIFIIHQLFTILKKQYLGTYWALKNGSPLIFYLMDIEKRCLHVAREAITKRVKTAQGKQTCLVWDIIEAIRFKHPHTMVNIHNIGVLESRVGWWENNSKSSAEASPQLISW